MIINADMHALVTRASRVLATVVRHSVTGPVEAWKLLDVHVKHVTRIGMLMALNRLFRLQVSCTISLSRRSTAVTVEYANLSASAICLAVHLSVSRIVLISSIHCSGILVGDECGR